MTTPASAGSVASAGHATIFHRPHVLGFSRARRGRQPRGKEEARPARHPINRAGEVTGPRVPFRNSINLRAFGLRGLRGRSGAATMAGLAGGRIWTSKVAIAVAVFGLGLASSAVTSQARPEKSAGGGAAPAARAAGTVACTYGQSCTIAVGQAATWGVQAWCYDSSHNQVDERLALRGILRRGEPRFRFAPTPSTPSTPRL